MKSVGNFCIVLIEDSTSSSGIQIKSDGMGKVHSCVANPELEGKTVLYDDRQRFVTHNEYVIINIEYIMAVIE
jgi:hypothetical protein